MQFITIQFFIFFVGIFLISILLKGNKKYYRVFCLFVSLAFYQFFGLKFFAILILNICLNFLLLKALERFGKKILVFSVVLNVVFLAAFKYYNFGIDTIFQVLNQLNIPADIQVLRILIPVGISFYTFRNISHLVDCYRKELPIPSFIDYANYVAFFPQIMSGPIMRAKDFYTSLNDPYLITYSQGRIITLILSGLLKKFVIASYLFNFASAPFASPSNYSSPDLIMAALAYSIMIFVDFSGYSDFAIAISNLLGFKVDNNFLNPYSAIGLKDFWNRWHISLSAWLKDYIYIPLGGSRKGTTRKYINIVITMFISGLWHGAGLNFIVWGLLHGIGSVVSHLIADIFNRSSKVAKANLKIANKSNVEKASVETRSGGITFDADEDEFDKEIDELLQKIDEKPVEVKADTEEKASDFIFPMVLNVIGWAVTFIYVTFAWIFFTSSSIGNALNFIGSMFVSSVVENKIFNFRLLFVIAVVLLFNFVGDKTFRFSIGFFDKMPLAVRLPVVAVLAYLILQLGPETMPPFIYFAF